MILETLKHQYDDQPISNIETAFTRYRDLSAANRKDFILGLYYLERTNRFKENTLYKKATFERYIGDVFAMKYNTYNNERFAFIANPEAAEKFGPGLVSRIKENCGAEKINDVVKAIEDVKDVSAIDKIIEKNSKRSKKEKKAADDKAKETKKAVENENARHIKTIADYIKTIAEKDEQILKLSKTVMELKAENASLKKENDDFKRYSTANPFYATMGGFNENHHRATA